MEYVWYVQDNNDMTVREVFTTKKAAFAKAKETYGQARFATVAKGRIYEHMTPDDRNDPVCTLWKVPVRHATRKKPL